MITIKKYFFDMTNKSKSSILLSLLPLETKTVQNKAKVGFTFLFISLSFISLIYVQNFANATTTTSFSLGQSLQKSQQELQSSINKQVQQTFTNTINSINNNNSNNNSNNNFNNNNTTATNIQQNNNTLITKILAKNLENHIKKAGAILEITSKLPQVRDVPYAHLLNQTLNTLHGIPQNADIEKRQVAKDILLSSNSDFYEIGFFMNNGDFYISEPYSEQQLSSITNIAFRDYFKGAIKTNDTYLGNVISSKDDSSIITSVIATPVYSLEDNSTIVGLWAGGIDLGIFNNELQSFNLKSLGKDGILRVVYVDSNGQKVADSDINKSKSFESFATLNSFKNAVKGQLDPVIDGVDNKKMLVSYQPVKMFNNMWVVLLMQPLPQE
jgi:hypothetical protein